MWEEKKKSTYPAALIYAPILLQGVIKSLDLTSPMVVKAIFAQGLKEYPALRRLFSPNTLYKCTDDELRLLDESLMLHIREKEGRRLLRRQLLRMYGTRFIHKRNGNTQQFPAIRQDKEFWRLMDELLEESERRGGWNMIRNQLCHIPLCEWLHFATQGSPMSIKTGTHWRLREIRWSYLGCSLCLAARSREDPKLENCATGEIIPITRVELLPVRAWTKRPDDPRRTEEPLLVPVGLKKLLYKLS